VRRVRNGGERLGELAPIEDQRLLPLVEELDELARVRIEDAGQPEEQGSDRLHPRRNAGGRGCQLDQLPAGQRLSPGNVPGLAGGVLAAAEQDRGCGGIVDGDEVVQNVKAAGPAGRFPAVTRANTR